MDCNISNTDKEFFEKEIADLQRISFNNKTYRLKDLILINKTRFPCFGSIKRIIINRDKQFCFIYDELNTINFDEHLCAFEVKYTKNTKLIFFVNLFSCY